GRDHVAQIITFGTLAAKAAIRDVGRVMGLPYAKVDRIAKLVPDMTRSLASAAEEIEALRAEVERDPEVRQIVEVGSRLEGLTRHHSMHAAGVVITPRPIEELVPLCKTNNDEVITQWDKDVVESLGLLKLDFLGLRTLTVIDDTLKLLAHQGIELDLDEVPLDDESVYKLFCDGRTNGIFQFESGGMKDLLRRARPSKFDDLAAFNALYRPGALSVGMVEEFIQRKQGRKKVFYLLPETRPILEETYGVIAYQEQVMQIAVEVAGFTRGEADVLRKAMGKKKAEVMAQQKEKFVAGAEHKGIDPNKARALWEQIEPFAGYGFNKSHSVAYALLAYKTAYLKTHYPVAFMAAMLSSEMSSKDNVGKYIQECRDMGIEVLPPDVCESSFSFTVTEKAVRFGLGAIKGVGEGAVEAVLEARRQVHRFRSLAHFAVETDLKAVNHKVFECLIKGGAFDALGFHRAALVEALDRIFEYGQERRRERELGQGTLFGASDLQEPEPDAATPEWPEKTRLRMEKEALGLYLTGNPLSEHQGQLESLTTHRTSELEGVEGKVTLGGLVTRIRRVKIKSGPNAGRLMGRFVLEDLQGTLAVTLFADILQRFDHLLEEDRPVVVTGLLRDRGAESELTVEEIVPLEAATGKLLKEVELSVGDSVARSDLLALREALTAHRGEVPVCLVVRLADHTVQVVPQLHGVRFDDDFTRTVEEILGPGTVRGRYAISQG
ncbi:MAG: DNA polymerase III subunit alpha, partial [bacterium]|nr:DNA polymerase III subunit alpha [bacterium]